MSVIARAFGVGIVAVDVQSGAVVDCAPQDQGGGGGGADGARACVVVYSGIHYDAVALVPDGAALDDRGFDVLQFDWPAPGRRPGSPPSPEGGQREAVLAAAGELARILRARGYYTDAASFGVRCTACGWRGAGERAATEHGNATGHGSFVEEKAEA